ncbi:MAG: MBL fold metallo-hydrolase [Nanobdellota archaeon]
MNVCVLASGSSGNCFFIDSERGGILIDAGISCKQICTRLEGIGKSMADVHSIFVTHEHSDHVSGLRVLANKFDVDIYLSKGTFCSLPFRLPEERVHYVGRKMVVNGAVIESFFKSHDAAEPVSYLVSDAGKTVSVITDLGYACHEVKQAVGRSDAVVLESNHDLGMLERGKYPFHLKRRISGKEGHLSNYDASLLVLEHGSARLKHVLLSHLSKENNSPEMALWTFGSLVRERKDLTVDVQVTGPQEPCFCRL